MSSYSRTLIGRLEFIIKVLYLKVPNLIPLQVNIFLRYLHIEVSSDSLKNAKYITICIWHYAASDDRIVVEVISKSNVQGHSKVIP
jgi:hypothetical protein